MKNKYQHWKNIPKLFGCKETKEIKEFVDCYLRWSGLAGICDSCRVQALCLGINVDCGHKCPEGFSYYSEFKGLVKITVEES